MPYRQPLEPGDPGSDASLVDPVFDASPFGALGGDLRREVRGAFEVVRLPPRHVLAGPGRGVPRRLVLVGAGRVRVERPGREVRSFPLAFRGPGDSVGEAALVAGRPPAESAVVVDPVVALAAPASRLRDLAEAHPAVLAATLELLLAARAQADARLVVLLRGDVRARLADVLLGAVARWGAPHAAGELVAAPFTHADLAALVGSTRETTTVVLSRMRAEGLIAFDRRRIVVPSRAALAACVASA